MGRFDKNIYKIIKILCCIFLLFMVFCIYAANENGLGDAILKTFKSPMYNDETHKLEYILTGENVRTSDNLINLEDVRLEILADDGVTVQSVITTPMATYDRTNDYLSGDQKVFYQALPFDASGLGFDFSKKTKNIHIRKDVTVIIKDQEQINLIRESRSDTEDKNEKKPNNKK